MARVESSAGHVPHRPGQADRLVRGVRRQDQPTVGGRTRADPLGEPALVVLDETHGPLDDRTRTPVVDLQVHPSKAGQTTLERQDPPDIGQPPAVDRLVVVADEEDPVRGGGQEQGQIELGSIDVLDLVHEQLPTAARATGRGAPGRLRGRGSPAG